MTTAIAIQPSLRVRQAPVVGPVRPAPLRLVPARGPVDPAATDLDRIGSLQVAARGATLVEEGDPADHVFKVVSGALRTVRLLPDGRRSVIDFVLPGDFFGMAENGTYAHSLEVLADGSFIRYPKKQLRDVLNNDPQAGRTFLNLMCEQLSAAQDRLLTLCRKSAVERIASFLLGMADRSPAQGTAASVVVKLPMNRADIADYLGLTIETVSRVLTQLRERNLIEVPTVNQVILRDCERLAAIGEGEA